MKKENVIFSLVNTEHYNFILRDVPHRAFEDLSIVYYEFEPEEAIYHLISNDYMESAKFCEEDLYEFAFENTRRFMPPEVLKMASLIEKIEGALGLQQNKEDAKDAMVYVIRNEQGARGAVSILYNDVMEDVAEKIGGDFYLIPSSMHEFIAIPKPLGVSLDDLQEHVHYTNLMHVKTSDRLSHQVYEYDTATGQVKQATFSPYTKLNAGRPVWSDWILNDKPIPPIETSEGEQTDTGMQMGM